MLNDEEVSDFDNESEDLPDVSPESENNGDSSKNEAELMENTDDSGMFVRTVYIWNQTFFIYEQCRFVF